MRVKTLNPTLFSVKSIFDRKIHLAGPSNGNILFFVHTQSNYVNLSNLGTFQDSINKYVLLSNQKNLKFPKKIAQNSQNRPNCQNFPNFNDFKKRSKNLDHNKKPSLSSHQKKISNFQKNRQNSQNRPNCQTFPNFYLCNTYF